jgi:hypothetical protein
MSTVSLVKPVSFVKKAPATELVSRVVTLRVTARVTSKPDADVGYLLEEEVLTVLRGQLAYPDAEREPGDLVQQVFTVESVPPF